MIFRTKRCLAIFIAMIFLCGIAPLGALASPEPVNLDLSSGLPNVRASSAANFTPSQINVGGVLRSVDSSSMLTASEFLALQQVLSTGMQSINVATGGHAVGGTVSTASFGAFVANLVIPQGVTAIHDAGVAQALNLSGNLTNAGRLLAVSTNSAVTNAIFNASNIYNQQGALLSSVLPSSGLRGFANAVPRLDLTLNAAQDIINSGTMSSSGNLNLRAGGSIVNAQPPAISGPSPLIQAIANVNLDAPNMINSGSIRSATGDINIASATAQANQSDFSERIDNTAGVIEALNGAINIGHPLYSGKMNLTLTGGDLLSNQLNFNLGSGIVDASVDKISGQVNINAGVAHLGSASGDLHLGNLHLIGDPTFFNDAGNIDIAGDITVGEALTIAASGNITASSNATISAHDDSHGFDITLIAGAKITPSTPGALTSVGPYPTAGTPATGDITISGASTTGGSILFNSHVVNILSRAQTGDNHGGDVTLIAYGQPCGDCDGVSTTSNAGRILFSPSALIDASGSGQSYGGQILMIAGANDGGVAISAPRILTTGILRAITGQPFLSENLTITPNGTVPPSPTPPLWLVWASTGSAQIIGSSLSGTGIFQTGWTQIVSFRPALAFSTATQSNGSIVLGGSVQSGSLALQAGQSVSIDSCTLSTGFANILSPRLIFQNTSSNPAINAGDLFISGYYGPMNDGSFQLIAPSGGEVSITSDYSYFAGSGIHFTSSGEGDASIHFGGRSVEIGSYFGSSTASTVIDRSVPIYSDSFMKIQGLSVSIGSNFSAAAGLYAVANNLRISSPTMSIAGTLQLSAQQITIDSSALTLSGSGSIEIHTPHLVFANSIHAPSIIATGASSVTMDGSTAPLTPPPPAYSGGGGVCCYLVAATSILSLYSFPVGYPMVIELPGGAITTISTNGGSTRIGSSGVNGSLRFTSSGFGTAGLSLNGGSLQINGGASLTLDRNVAVRSDNQINVSMNARSGISIGSCCGFCCYADTTFVNNGLLSSNVAGTYLSAINLDASNSNLILSGSGTFEGAGTTPANITVLAGKITLDDATDLHFRSDRPGGKTVLNSSLIVANGTATLHLQNNDVLSIASSYPLFYAVCCLGSSGSYLQFPSVNTGTSLQFKGGPTGGTLNIDGAPLTTEHFGIIGVDANFTLKSNSSITFSTSRYYQCCGAVYCCAPPPPNVATLILDGSIQTTGTTSGVTIDSAGSLVVRGTGSIMTQSGGLIQFRASTLSETKFTANTNLKLLGNVEFACCGGQVKVEDGGIVNYAGSLTIEACDVTNIDAFVGSARPTINICTQCGNPGGGTIVSSRDLVLNRGLLVNSNGRDVAIIAGGNITANGLTTINLSSNTGNAGNLFILAGVSFAGNLDEQKKDTDLSSIYLAYGGSSTGGSVQLGSVSINTSSSATNGSGGKVTIGAFAGSAAPGSINIGSINTSAAHGRAGDVLLVAPGAVNIAGSITTRGWMQGGDVEIAAATPRWSSPLPIANGIVAGSISANCVTCPAYSTISIFGGIDSTSSAGEGGVVSLSADKLITIGGDIVTGGRRNSGDVYVRTGFGAFILKGSVNTSGLDITTQSASARAGNMTIGATAFVDIAGNVLLKGGASAGTTGGAGGTFNMLGPATGALGYHSGSLVIHGYVDVSGGNSTGTGGAGGSFDADAGRVAISGMKNGVSLRASGGNGLIEQGVDGSVSIHTYAVQTLPTNFDLLSTSSSELALPGGMFVVGETKTVNGTRGSIVAGESVANSATMGNTGRLLEGDFSTGNISLHVSGGAIQVQKQGRTVTIDPRARTLVNPGVALALYQLSRTGTGGVQTIGLNASGQVIDAAPGGATSILNVDSWDLNPITPFSNFVVATKDRTNRLTLNVGGSNVLLNLGLAGSVSIAGTINLLGYDSRIDFGRNEPVITQTGSITTRGTLALVGSARRFTNLGNITAGDLQLLHPESPLFFQMGNSGLLSAPTASYFVPASVSITAPQLTIIGGSLSGVRLNFNSASSGSLYVASSFINFAAVGNVSTGTIRIVAPASGETLRIAGSINGSSILLDSPVGITVESYARLFASAAMALTTRGEIRIADHGLLQAGSNLNLSGTQIDIGNYSTLKAGDGSFNVSNGILLSSDIVSKGSLSLHAGSGGISIGSYGYFTSYGNSGFVSEGDMVVGDGNRFSAFGGSLYQLATGVIVGGRANSFLAKSLGAVGGGLELASGISDLSLLNTAFAQKSGTAPAPSTLGDFVSISNRNNTSGVVRAITTGGGILNLSSNGWPASLLVNGGAMVFAASGPGSRLQYDGGSFSTVGIRPVSFSPGTGADLTDGVHRRTVNAFIDARADRCIETEYGQVWLKKGALALVRCEYGRLVVLACSGPGHISVQVGSKVIALLPGQELRVGTRSLTDAELIQPDRIGRRGKRTYCIERDTYATISEFSIVSLMQNSEDLQDLRAADTAVKRAAIARMVKTAAILQQIAADRGPYKAG